MPGADRLSIHTTEIVTPAVRPQDQRSLLRQDYVQRLQDISGFGEISHEEQTQDEFAVLDRAGRLQLPQDYLERLGLDGGKRVRLSFTDGKVEITALEKE